MKPYFIIISALALASCTGNGSKNNDTSKTAASRDTSSKATKLNTPAQNMEYCFLSIENNGADSTKVHLVINANKVSGDMQWLPKEKDARKGTLTGTLKGDIINADWNYMQEGSKQTMAVGFKISAQQLAAKPLMVNTATGEQQVNNNANYTVIYNLYNCK